MGIRGRGMCIRGGGWVYGEGSGCKGRGSRYKERGVGIRGRGIQHQEYIMTFNEVLNTIAHNRYTVGVSVLFFGLQLPDTIVYKSSEAFLDLCQHESIEK